MAEALKIIFPLLMVAGAAGSVAVNALTGGDWPTTWYNGKKGGGFTPPP